MPMKRQPMLEDMIGWSHQQGYYRASDVARTYAQQTGTVPVLHDLGTYGDIIQFFEPDHPLAQGDKELP
jgi:hypothetical protein